MKIRDREISKLKICCFSGSVDNAYETAISNCGVP